MEKLKLFSREQVGNAPLTGRQYSRPDSLSLVSRQSVLAFLLVLLTTVFGVGNAWGETSTLTEGFETKSVGTNYQGTVTVSTSESDCGIGWSIYYGTVSTNDKITGNNSAQMRYYSSSNNRGYVQTTTAVEGLSHVAFKARVSSTNIKMTVSYSEDASEWTALATDVTFSETGKGIDFEYDVPSGGKYIKIEIGSGSTKPSSGNIKFIVDDVVFTYEEAAPAEPHTVSFSTGSGNPAVSPITETSGGAGIILPAGPTPTCFADGWAFAGWKETSAVTEQTTTAPTLLAAGTNFKPSDDVTLFAVYKKTETGEVTDLDKTEGFETKATGTTYNSTVTISEAESDCGIGWSIYFGTVATNDKIAGNNSGHMRWYSTSTSSLPYAKTTTAISGLQSVNFKARVSNTAVKMSLWYSTNGEDWTLSDVNQETFTAANTAYDFSATISGTVGTNYYVKIGEDGGTAPSSGNYKLIIDAVQFNYKAGASTTYYLSAPSCCEKHAINIANDIENGSVSADLNEACEGTTVTLTATPDGSYHFEAWSVKDADENIITVDNEGKFTMPATAVTVSATFVHDACTNLAAPTLDAITKDYKSATIAWNTVTDAVSYVLNVAEHNGDAVLTDASVTTTSKELTGLKAETQYDYSVMAVGDGSDKCAEGNALLEGNFTTDALPTVKLTLMNLGVEHEATGNHAILTPFNLPSTAASCSKTFVGWSANSECAEAPEYAAGAEFTFNDETPVTLYAVYATETAGAATLTKMESSYVPAAGDNIVIVAVVNENTSYALYQETQSNSYVKYWAFDNAVATVAADTKKYVTLEAATDGKFYLGDATNGYVYSSGSNNLSVDASNKTAWTIAWDDTNSAFTFNQGRYLSCRSDLDGTNKYLYRLAGGTPAGTYMFDVYKYGSSASSYSNYATTCTAAPEAIVDPEKVNAAATSVENGVIEVAYDNVNEENVTVDLFNDAACTVAFDGEWLSATINGDKNIAYTIAENTTYVARKAYIKLTAPETNGATDPAVVIIPVEQAGKATVFASLEDLVAADLASGTEVTVSFSNVLITEVYETNAGYRYGLYLNVKDKDGVNDIELFYNKQNTSEQVPDTWVKNGYVSATNLVTTWTEYKGQWELAMQGATWSWENGDITYGAPKAVSSVVVSGEPTKKTYVDGEAFKPAGLMVTVNYTVGDPEVIDAAAADWAFTPAKLSIGNTSVEVVATYNSVSSEAFEVTGLTVGEIPNKTVQEFITAGNADMRCYLEGVVSDIETGNKLKYGNFNLTDASGTIYVYGCLNQAGVAEKFDELGVSNGDKIKVIAEDYDYYNSKHEAKNVEFVSVKKAATVTFDDLAMEIEDVATIEPKTITLAEASAVVYSIKEGSDDCVTLDGAQITATAVGTATIVATLEETIEYVGTTAEFTVTVTEKDTRKVANASAFAAISGDMTPSDITFAAYKGNGTNDPVVRSTDDPVAIRLYKPASTGGTGNYLTLKAKVGCTIDQVQITFSGNADAAYCKDDEALTTEKYITSKTVLLTPAALGAQSVSIVNLKNGSIDVNAIKVWYNGEPLPIDHYFLGGTYETEFVQYSQFDYTGLQVFAAYDEERTITEEIFDFTVVADLMTAGNKKAEVYRGEDKIAEYDITVTESPKQNPALAYDPTSAILTFGQSLSAPTLNNPFSLVVSYASDNEAVATVDADGNIALAGGTGTAIITASYAADETYIASEATFTITVNEPTEDLSGTWVVATSVAAGDRIIIGATYQDATKTMGAQNTNNRAAVTSALADGVLSPEEGTKTFLVVDAGDGKFALQALNGKYLTASGTGTKNYLTETADYEADNAKWTISFEENEANVVASSNNRNTMRYNSGDGLFSCYATGGQRAINIYKQGTPDYGSYQRTVTAGNYGTICLPKAGTIEGATLFEIASFENGMIYMDEVGSTMEAGKPYIFQATADQLNVTYTSGTQVAAGEANGLHGFYNLSNMATDAADKLDLEEEQGNYILYQNAYWLVKDRAAYINNFRAYIKIGEIENTPAPEPTLGQAPRRRVAMAVHGEQVATGMDNVQGDNVQCTKVMINGQLYIMYNGTMYNVQGQLVR